MKRRHLRDYNVIVVHPKKDFSVIIKMLVIIKGPIQDLVQKNTILYNSILDTDCDKIVCLS